MAPPETLGDLLRDGIDRMYGGNVYAFAKALSQRTSAKDVDSAKGTVYRWLRDANVPSAENAAIVRDMLGISLQDWRRLLVARDDALREIRRRLESVATSAATTRADLDSVIETQTQGAAGLAALRERIDRIEDRLDRLEGEEAESADGP